MYSKQENQKLKKEFWVSFSEKYPRKWILYDTKIKDFSFKFYVENTKVQVIIDIEHRNETKRIQYFDKLVSLKNILDEEFVADLVFERNYCLENGKNISRVWVELGNVSVNNRNSWEKIFTFFSDKMSSLERFYAEYDEYIMDID